MTTDEHTPTQAESDHELYLRWLDKRKLADAAKKREQQERADRATRDIELHAGVALGAASNDGTGHCKWCRIVLGSDGKGNRTHPLLRECPGPAPAPCDLCGSPYTWYRDTYQWWHQCTGRKIAGPRAQQLEQVQQAAKQGEAMPDRGVFGYRRGEE